jgi:hypothetical protein
MLIPSTLKPTLIVGAKITHTLQMRHEISADRQQMRSMTTFLKVQLKNNTNPYSISRTPILTSKTTCNSPCSSSFKRHNLFKIPNYPSSYRVEQRISPFKVFNVTRKWVNMKKKYNPFKSLNKSQTSNKKPKMLQHSNNNALAKDSDA